MSYCRWSTDDYQCDLYVYESPEGFAIHVASNRLVYHQELPEPVSILDDMERWGARHRQILNWLDDDTQHHREPIGLPHDGETFDCIETPGEAAETLQALAAEGYQFPVEVINVLRDEQRELDEATRRPPNERLPRHRR